MPPGKEVEQAVTHALQPDDSVIGRRRADGSAAIDRQIRCDLEEGQVPFLRLSEQSTDVIRSGREPSLKVRVDSLSKRWQPIRFLIHKAAATEVHDFLRSASKDGVIHPVRPLFMPIRSERAMTGLDQGAIGFFEKEFSQSPQMRNVRLNESVPFDDRQRVFTLAKDAASLEQHPMVVFDRVDLVLQGRHGLSEWYLRRRLLGIGREPDVADRMLDAHNHALAPAPADAFLSAADRRPDRPDLDVDVAARFQRVAALLADAAHDGGRFTFDLHGHLGEVASGHGGLLPAELYRPVQFVSTDTNSHLEICAENALGDRYLAVHQCPECGDSCDCDGEDHGQVAPNECSHECEDYDDDDDGYNDLLDDGRDD